jgi:hypothetical protein
MHAIHYRYADIDGAFAGDAPGAEIRLLGGGHFLLESRLHAAAGIIGRFLESTAA